MLTVHATGCLRGNPDFAWVRTLAGGTRWFQHSGTIQPWVEAAAGLLLARAEVGGSSSDATGLFLRGGVGASSFVSERVAIDGGLRIEGRTLSFDNSDFDVDSTEIWGFLGISTFF